MAEHPEADQIYLGRIIEVFARLEASEKYLGQFSASGYLPEFDSAVLQLRKAMEATAFAAIAPNHLRYAAFRAQAERCPDYRKDYNAREIFLHLTKINPDFFPLALQEPVRQPDGSFHFDLKVDGFITKGKFQRLYDRLGKFLHADNPWGDDKGAQNLAVELPHAIDLLRGLLARHRTIVRTDAFSGVLVVEIPTDGRQPNVLRAGATGEFVVAS